MTSLDSRDVAEIARRLIPVHRAPWAVARARTSLTERTVRLGAEETASVQRGALWDYGDHRARGRHAHGFTFLVDWVGAVPQLEDSEASELVELVVELFADWDARYGRHPGSAPEMAFHDETTAQRLLGLVTVLDLLPLSAERWDTLADLAGRTAALLRAPEFYGGVNNHGMFQDLALLAWSVLVAKGEDPARRESWDLAERRLQEYFASCFTSEGVHVENTPTYHVMVSRYLPVLDELFTSAESPSADLYHQILAGASHYAVHCVTPEALYPPVSDTHRRRLDNAVNLETFPGGEFEYAVTAGARGTRPPLRTATFPDSGYAMSRSAWGDPQASYVYFSCAYNADYHKHSDENSLYLRSGGRDLLSESGPYGYNWNDPFTKYAYSSAAHNTLMVDGTGLPRTEPAAERRGATPPLDELTVHSADDDLLDVTGTTRRFRGRQWSRRLLAEHGATPSRTRLRLEDDITSEVGAGDLRFHWHLGPGLRVRLRSHGAEVFDGPTKVMEVEFTTSSMISLKLLEGAEEPSIQGWSFPKFGERVPSPVILVESHASDLSMTTEVRLDEFVWDEQESGTFETLVINERTVPTVHLPAPDGERATSSVLFLSSYGADADLERLLTELVKAEVPVRYVPVVPDRIANAGSVEPAEVALERFATAAGNHVRREAERGTEVAVVTVGAAFAPGAIAALTTGAQLIALDPRLPFRARDTRADLLAARLDELAGLRSSAEVDVVLSGEDPGQADRVLTALGGVVPTRRDLSSLLRADVEDVFSDMILNGLRARAGESVLYTAVYDRRQRAFQIELPRLSDVEVSVRVFRGKDEVHAMPYTAGSAHRVPYTGSGPHRLRVHVRGQDMGEPAVFTTGTIRVR